MDTSTWLKNSVPPLKLNCEGEPNTVHLCAWPPKTTCIYNGTISLNLSFHPHSWFLVRTRPEVCFRKTTKMNLATCFLLHTLALTSYALTAVKVTANVSVLPPAGAWQVPTTWYCYPVDDIAYRVGSNPIEALSLVPRRIQSYALYIHRYIYTDIYIYIYTRILI